MSCIRKVSIGSGRNFYTNIGFLFPSSPLPAHTLTNLYRSNCLLPLSCGILHSAILSGEVCKHKPLSCCSSKTPLWSRVGASRGQVHSSPLVLFLPRGGHWSSIRPDLGPSVKSNHSLCGAVWKIILTFLACLLSLPFWREQSAYNESVLHTPSPNPHRTLPCTVSCHQESQSASSLLVGNFHGSLFELPPPAGEQVSVLKLA